ncbi:Ig-like domain-containing protein [Actinoplanes subglobosus]|uniref:Ig-like domain-containing protein n=1 Tax=Actinoplanes subglobosus TaxID=1547892 RepID=A0ABV8IRT7_9ACTN
MKLLSALAAATAALLLSASPAHAVPADPLVVGTGLTAGQLVGNHPTIHPVYADGAELAKVEVIYETTVMATFTAPVPEALTFWVNGFHDRNVTFTVRAYDVDGNVGEASTPIRVDLRAPSTIVYPAAMTNIGGITTVEFRPRDDDLARVEIQDMAGNTLAKTTQAPWVLSWDTRPLHGITQVQLIIRDHADNNWDQTRKFLIDNAPPFVNLLLPADQTLIRGSTVTRIFASDESGLFNISVKDGTPTDSPLSWIVNPTEQGPYTIVWSLSDRRGLTTVAERVVINDTVAADLQITAAPEDGSTLTGPVQITADASDLNGIDRVELLVDGAVVATDTEAGYDFTVTPEEFGTTFTVQLRAHDRAGNVTTGAELTYHR